MTDHQDLLARLRAAKPDKPGWWMVERDDGKTRPLYLTQPGGAGGWTTDWREGFQFAEREPAEQQVELWHSAYGYVRSHGMMAEHFNRDGPEAADTLERYRDALEWFDKHAKTIINDVSSAHSGRGAGASEWMRKDDSDFRSDLRKAFERVSTALSISVP